MPLTSISSTTGMIRYSIPSMTRVLIMSVISPLTLIFMLGDLTSSVEEVRTFSAVRAFPGPTASSKAYGFRDAFDIFKITVTAQGLFHYGTEDVLLV